MILMTPNTANQSTCERTDVHQQTSLNPLDVLNDLFGLLEEYGPGWYTEEHYKRIRATLLLPWSIKAEGGKPLIY